VGGGADDGVLRFPAQVRILVVEDVVVLDAVSGRACLDGVPYVLEDGPGCQPPLLQPQRWEPVQDCGTCGICDHRVQDGLLVQVRWRDHCDTLPRCLHPPAADVRVPRIELMTTRPEIVCICGSARFVSVMRAASWELSCSGVIVLAPARPTR